MYVIYILTTRWREDMCTFIFIGRTKSHRESPEIPLDRYIIHERRNASTSRGSHTPFPIARNVSNALVLYLLSMGAICQIICIWRARSSWNLQPGILRNGCTWHKNMCAPTAHTRRIAISVPINAARKWNLASLDAPVLRRDISARFPRVPFLATYDWRNAAFQSSLNSIHLVILYVRWRV